MLHPAQDRTLFIIYGASPLPDQELISACREAIQDNNKAAGGKLYQQKVKASQSTIGEFEIDMAFLGGPLLQQLIGIAQEAARHYARVLSHNVNAITRLAGVLQGTLAEGCWDGAIHAIMAGMIVDMGVLHQLIEKRAVSEQPDQCWVWAFRGGTGATNRCGVRAWKWPSKTGFLGQVWHNDCARPQTLKILDEDVSLLAAMATGEKVAAATMNEKMLTQAVKLSFYRLLVRNNGSFALNVPVLQGEQGVAFVSEIETIAGDLFQEAVSPAMEVAQELLKVETGTDSAILRHAFARLLLEHAVDELIDVGVLPPFPKHVSNSWGTWLNLVCNA